ncbi:MAG: glycosyltransferase family protein [Lachnospiraceae bacterium]|nr:glycosyltransferase family protein [Lachnospiraceae bacterium]
MNYLLIIQARMGSSRLPNKVLKELCGKPMLQHIIERTTRSRKIDGIMVATTVREEDWKIEELCQRISVECFRGSENDVLDRYYQAASKYQPEHVVRVTADCPFIDPIVIDEIIQIHEAGKYDYTSNTLVETYPDGLDTEVFTFGALEKAWKEADLASEREHVTPYIKFKGGFNRYSVERSPSLADKRWTVDTETDFEVVTQVYNSLYGQKDIFLMEDILTFMESHRHIEQMNENTVRNEGYLKTIANDHVVWEKK